MKFTGSYIYEDVSKLPSYIDREDIKMALSSHNEYIVGTFKMKGEQVDGVTISLDDGHADDREVLTTFLDHVAEMATDRGGQGKTDWDAAYLLIARRGHVVHVMTFSPEDVPTETTIDALADLAPQK